MESLDRSNIRTMYNVHQQIEFSELITVKRYLYILLKIGTKTHEKLKGGSS